MKQFRLDSESNTMDNGYLIYILYFYLLYIQNKSTNVEIIL